MSVGRVVFTLVVVMLVASSCGGSDDTTTTAGLIAPETVTTAGPVPAETTTTADGSTAVEECTNEATEITVGSPVTDEIVGSAQPPGERLYFCVEIPTEVTSITFALTGMTADLNLYVGYPDLQTVQEGGFTFWTTANERGTDDKVIVVEPGLAEFVNAGSYYIEVSAHEFEASSPFSLTVET